MKKETLEKGKKIQEEINDLKNHLNDVFRPSENKETYKYNPFGFEASKDGRPTLIPCFYVKPFFSENVRRLRNEFVPFPVDNFMAIYKIKVEEKITQLEKEFENLKD